METIHLFMPLLTELAGFGGGLCYNMSRLTALLLHRKLSTDCTLQFWTQRLSGARCIEAFCACYSR